VLGRLSLALRTGDRSQPEAIDVLRAAADMHHPLADVAANHRHDYILATEAEAMDHNAVVNALRGWLASFEEAAIEARLGVPLVWHALSPPSW
jgi:hypothetical protein